MGATNAIVAKGAARILRKHTKSKKGCGNCKLRQVKCDETKPMCRRCEKYGTFCDYDTRYSKMQPWAPGTLEFRSIRPSACSEHQTILSIINQSPGFQLERPAHLIHRDLCVQDLETLHKFNERTILTLVKFENINLYRNVYAKLIPSHPFLLHAVLSLTLMHDEYLENISSKFHSPALAYHWSQGAALLNQKLSQEIVPTDRDALWASAGILGALALSSVPGGSPEEAWPLKSSTSADLDWLKMCRGKRAIWKIADPLRPDSIFYPFVPDFMQDPFFTPPPPMEELQSVWPEIISLCKLEEKSTIRSNPYLAAASFLARTVNVDCDEDRIGMFLSFCGTMVRSFENLLGCKDPCALLLLAYWYAKMCCCRRWWVWRRASLECQAILQYLERYHWNDDRILDALKYPQALLLKDILDCSPKNCGLELRVH